MGDNPKRVFNYTSGPAQTVVENSLLIVDVPLRIGLHEPRPKSECFVCDNGEGERLSGVGKRSRRWQSQGAIFNGLTQSGFSEHATV